MFKFIHFIFSIHFYISLLLGDSAVTSFLGATDAINTRLSMANLQSLSLSPVRLLGNDKHDTKLAVKADTNNQSHI